MIVIEGCLPNAMANLKGNSGLKRLEKKFCSCCILFPCLAPFLIHIERYSVFKEKYTEIEVMSILFRNIIIINFILFCCLLKRVVFSSSVIRRREMGKVLYISFRYVVAQLLI